MLFQKQERKSLFKHLHRQLDTTYLCNRSKGFYLFKSAINEKRQPKLPFFHLSQNSYFPFADAPFV